MNLIAISDVSDARQRRKQCSRQYTQLFHNKLKIARTHLTNLEKKKKILTKSVANGQQLSACKRCG